MAMFVGSRAMLPRGGKFSPHTFWEDTCQHGVTQVIVVPTMLSMLLANTATTFSKSKAPPLGCFRSVGAPLPDSVRQEVLAIFGLHVYEVSIM